MLWSASPAFATEPRSKVACYQDYEELRNTSQYPTATFCSRLLAPRLPTIVSDILERRSPAHTDASQDFDNQLAVVTGVHENSVALCVAQELALVGMNVILLGKSVSNLERCRRAIENHVQQQKNLQGQTCPKLDCVKFNLSSFESILAASTHVKRISSQYHDNQLHLLLNLATVGTDQARLTHDNLEYNTGCNFVGTHLFTKCLLDLLESTPRARVVNASSMGHCLGTNFVPERLGDFPEQGGAPEGYIHQNGNTATHTSPSSSLLEANSIQVDASEVVLTESELRKGVQRRGTQVGRSKLALLADTLYWNTNSQRDVSFYSFHLVKVQSSHSHFFWEPSFTPSQAAVPALRAALDITLPSGSYLHSDGQPWTVMEPAGDVQFGKRCYEAAERVLAQRCPQKTDDNDARLYEPPKPCC